MRWLMPPPAATAAFSSAAARRRLARVEDRGAGPGDRLDVAGGQRRDAGEVAEEVERGPLGRQQRPPPGRSPAAPRPAPPRATAPSTTRLSTLLDPALAHRLGDRREPEDDPGLFLHDPRPRPGALGHRRLEVTSPVADVLGQRPARPAPRRLVRSRSVIPRHPMSQGAGESHVLPPAAFNPQSDRAAAVPDPARRARRRRDGGLARRRRPRRGRGLLPGDLPRGAARLPEAATTTATCAAGC